MRVFSRLLSVVFCAALTALSVAACGGEDKASEGPGAGEGDVPAKRADQGERRNPADVFLTSIDAFNNSNAAKMRDSLSQDAAWWWPCGIRGPVRGIREIMRSLTAFKGLVPDARMGVRRILRRDNMVVAQTVTVGTKKWNEHGSEEEPKRLGFEGVYFVLSDDAGRAKETLPYFDQAVSMRQVGALKGEAAPIPEMPAVDPEIVDLPEVEGSVELATSAMATFGIKAEGLAALVAPEFAYVDMATGRKYDMASLPEHLANARLTESGLVYTVQQSLGAGPYVALRWEATGRFSGKGNVGPTDIVLHGVHVFRIEKDKIVAVEAYGSEFEYLQKTGLIAEAVQGDEDALGPRGKVPGEGDVEDKDKIGTAAPAAPPATAAPKPDAAKPAASPAPAAKR